MNKKIILTASFFGLLAVIFGAFGAHALRKLVDSETLSAWQTGVQYQFYHVMALLYLSTFARYKNRLINLAFISFTLGIILFSGSLYAITMCKHFQSDAVHFLGPITPIGGICFIFGWAFLFLAAFRDK